MKLFEDVIPVGTIVSVTGTLSQWIEMTVAERQARCTTAGSVVDYPAVRFENCDTAVVLNCITGCYVIHASHTSNLYTVRSHGPRGEGLANEIFSPSELSAFVKQWRKQRGDVRSTLCAHLRTPD